VIYEDNCSQYSRTNAFFTGMIPCDPATYQPWRLKAGPNVYMSLQLLSNEEVAGYNSNGRHQTLSRRARIVNHGRNRVYFKSDGAVLSQRLHRLLYVGYGKEAN
jgi:hypothetical protein